MGLMTGTGPLGLAAAGTWNFDPPAPGSAVYIEPSWKRVRAELEGQAVADSSHALLLSESDVSRSTTSRGGTSAWTF